MEFTANINILPHKELLDPQGKTICKNMKNIDLEGITDVRIGKRVVIQLEAATLEEAKQKVDQACKKMLVNVIMETYEFEVSPV